LLLRQEPQELVTAVNLNGVSRTIHWSGKSLAASLSGVTTTSGYDIFTFTGINTVGSASTTCKLCNSWKCEWRICRLMPFISRVSTGYQGYAKQGKLVVIQTSQVGIASTSL